jgi:eukaryotic-like serine/threonine-protein kinase
LANDHASEEEIFHRARRLESRPARQEYLRQACGENAALLARVRALLRVLEKDGEFLSTPVGVVAINERSPDEMPGAIVGPYTLGKQIGEGGFGLVFLAEQHQPVRRKVAVKVLKPGMDSRQIVARFEAERQALALMDHPNIAKMFDAGETKSGRPYFAMELVCGVPITKYCDANCLDTRARLDLMVTVCQAMQHAHQKGVIHRDLKPSNVLVAMQEGAAVVKIIDFGVAKAIAETIGEPLTLRATFTGINQLIGTPMYMSPEQAGLSGMDVDTRSDVYSLAVMMYELLTGTTPFDEQRLVKAGYEEMRRIIREEEPLRPSTRVVATEGAAAPQSAQRQGDPKGLSLQLKGELDWIIMKGLEKDRSRRYDSAGALARDTERYLHDEPVSASPPSSWYRLRKFARRHRWPLALAGVVAAALVVIAAGSLVAAFSLKGALSQSERDRQRAGTAEGNANKAATAARDAEKEAETRLYSSLLDRARAGRSSRRIGQRFQSLDALTKAARVARDLGTFEEHRFELRNEAIAAAALPDLRIDKECYGWSADGSYGDFDDQLERCVWTDKKGRVSVRRVADDHEIYALRVPAGESWPELSRDGVFLSVRKLSGYLSLWRLGGEKPERIIERSDCGRDTAFSPDNRYFALPNRRQTVDVYDLAAGQRRWQLAVNQAVVRLAFRPHRSQLAICTSQGIDFRNFETGESVDVLEPGVAFWSLVWHPDGDVLAGASDRDGKIFLWDVPAKKLLGKFEGIHNGGIALAFNHAGDLLASNGWDNVLRLWDWRAGRQIFATHCEYVSRPRFAADDQRLAADLAGKTLRLWQVSAGREYRNLSREPALGPANYQSGLAINPKGRLLASCLDDGVCFWDLQSGQQAGFVAFRKKTASLVFEQSGALLSFGDTGLLRWPRKQHETSSAAAEESVSLGPIQKLPMAATTCTMAASVDGAVIVSPRSPQPAIVWRRDQSPAIVSIPVKADYRVVAVSPDGHWVALGAFYGNTPGAVVWDARAGRIERELPLGEGCSVAFSADGKWLATVPAAGDVHFWSVGSWTQASSTAVSVTVTELNSIALSPDSAILAVGLKSGAISLIEVPSGRYLARLDDPDQDVTSALAFSPDGTWLAASSALSRSIHVWDLAAIRRQLDALGLDWERPPYPERKTTTRRAPLKVEIEPGNSN